MVLARHVLTVVVDFHVLIAVDGAIAEVEVALAVTCCRYVALVAIAELIGEAYGGVVA